MWKYFIQLIVEFGKNYWEVICSLLNLLKSNGARALIIIFTAISFLFIGMTYTIPIQTIINDFEYKDILWLLLIIFLPYIIMPFTLAAKCMKLKKELDNRKNKDQLCLKLKSILDDITKDQCANLSTINYFELPKKITALLRESSGIEESNIISFEYDTRWKRTDTIVPLIIDIIRKLKY